MSKEISQTKTVTVRLTRGQAAALRAVFAFVQANPNLLAHWDGHQIRSVESAARKLNLELHRTFYR